MGKYCFILLLILTIQTDACKKADQEFMSPGQITGQDYRMCACCGGWLIIIDGEIYLFETIPSNSNFALEKETLPISVELDWQITPGSCPNNRITIQRIKKR